MLCCLLNKQTKNIKFLFFKQVTSQVMSSSSSSREYRSGSPATKPKPTAPARKNSGASSLLQQQQIKSLIPTKKSSGNGTFINDVIL